MDSLSQVIPEIKSSSNAAEIPWKDAVVWAVQPRVGPRVYEWLGSEHIQYICWTNGLANIIPSPTSILSSSCQCIILPSGFIWVGKNVRVG
jgi:hypothetical protein